MIYNLHNPEVITEVIETTVAVPKVTGKMMKKRDINAQKREEQGRGELVTGNDRKLNYEAICEDGERVSVQPRQDDSQ